MGSAPQPPVVSRPSAALMVGSSCRTGRPPKCPRTDNLEPSNPSSAGCPYLPRQSWYQGAATGEPYPQHRCPVPRYGGSPPSWTNAECIAAPPRPGHAHARSKIPSSTRRVGQSVSGFGNPPGFPGSGGLLMIGADPWCWAPSP